MYSPSNMASNGELTNGRPPVESRALHVPDLTELAEVLTAGLRQNFAEASVKVVDCPDLTQSPWSLAAPGLGGSPRLLDIGGPPYLCPVPDRTRFYDLRKMAALVGSTNGFLFGPGAASSRIAGVNCELMANARLSSELLNCSHISKVSTKDGTAVLEKFHSLETGPLANILVCGGEAGKVLEIRAIRRTGPENFVSAMRKTLGAKYGQEPVAMAGVFVIVQGKAKIHVMPDFSEEPLNSREDVNKWLQFYNMSAPLTCLSEFVSHDPGMDLRVEHAHCFSSHGEGGHYHYDVTPAEVEYHGYYTVAEELWRIDRPELTNDIGRD